MNRLNGGTFDGVNGQRWFVSEMPQLMKDGSSNIAVVKDINNPLWFDKSGANYVARYFIADKLTENTTTMEFTHTDTTGRKTIFHSFDASIALNLQGQFKKVIDAFGHETVPAYNGSDQLTSYATSSSTTGGAYGVYKYAYLSAGNNTGKLETATYQVNRGADVNVRRVQNVYYDTGDSNGALGDLKTATVQQWDGSAWQSLGTSYYRYYTSDTAPGFTHGLKFSFDPEAFARLNTAMVAIGKTAYTATDVEAAPYADQYFEYDDAVNKRVSREKVKGGLLQYDYAYATSAFGNGYNNWKNKTTETLPGGAQNIVYTNYAGQIMLKVFKSGTDQWCEYWRYDTMGNVTLKAEPSAVASFSEASAGLVTLNASTGFIRIYDYFGSSSSSSDIGFAPYRLKAEKVKKGNTGSEIKVKEWQYTTRTAGGSTIYPVSAEVAYQSDASGGSSPATTGYAYTWHVNGVTQTTAVKQRTITWPAVSTAQNGPNATTQRVEVYDPFERLIWIKDERGFLFRTIYDDVTGAVSQSIQDFDTVNFTDPTLPAGWTTPAGGGLHIVTDYTFDDQGRTTRELGPTHDIDVGGTNTTLRRVKWTIYMDTSRELRTGMGYATGAGPSYTYTLINPVSRSLYDLTGRLTDAIVATRGSTSGALSASDSFPQTSWVRWSKYNYNNNSQLTYSRLYFLIPGSGDGASGTNYNETTYGYSAIDRQNKVRTPAGTITRSVFHPKDWLLSTWVGTNDTGATDSNPAGGGLPNNMKQVAGYEYDVANAAGQDGNLTKVTRNENASITRITTYAYDFRDRRTSTDGEIDFYEAYTYDNLDRVTQVDRRSTNAAGNLIGRSQTKYDNRGRVYQMLNFAVDPATGTPGNNLADNFWYDARGEIIKIKAGGSQTLQKISYDGLNRATAAYTTVDPTETTYADASTVVNDTVFAQHEITYDKASNIILQVTRQRFHDATGTGVITNPSGSQPKARVSYVALYPDAIGRIINSVDYGTNGGAAVTRVSTVPARSDTVIVSTTEYDSSGNQYRRVDPKGRVDRREFDQVGRVTKIIENYIDGVPSGDTDRTIEFTYNPDGRTKWITAKNSVTGDQITKYVYGTTLSDSEVASFDLLRAIIYPDSTDSDNPLAGTDHVEYKYNRLGEATEVKDQIGTVHAYDYDKLGRLTQDRVTTVGAGVDTAVRRLARTYEVRGMLLNATSFNNATVGSGTVINDTQFAYNTFSQLATEYQAHGGAVNTGTSPKVRYAYANGSANTIRPTSVTYPNGRVITYDYGTANGNDDLLSRVSSIKDGATTMAGYTYLGLDRRVRVHYAQAGVELTYIKQGAEPNGPAGDQYAGLDSFGRVIDQRWLLTSSGAALERVQYGFDRASNRQWRDNLVAASGQDEYYTYDGLYQLINYDRGTLNAGKTAISGTPIREEDFTFDPTGNWSGYITKNSGTTELNQARTDNKANEVTNITETVGTAWVTPLYDAAGNMAETPQPAALTSKFTNTFDAWYRLVKVMNGAATVATYQYDGLNRRTVKTTATARHYYYSDRWQILEERTGVATCAERQFVWGLRYLDDLVARDRDTANNCSALSERLYALHDYFNVTALVNTSGAVQERYGYDPYGTPRFMNNAFGSIANSAYGWETLYGAYRWDGETGLYQVRNRYFHPKLGGWISRDPLRFADGPNLYSYTRNQPVTFIDKYGLVCGTPGIGDMLVPDSIPGVFDFSPCCEAHDRCYGFWEDTRSGCDQSFLDCTRDRCQGNPCCNGFGQLYYIVLRLFGGPAYNGGGRQPLQMLLPFLILAFMTRLAMAAPANELFTKSEFLVLNKFNNGVRAIQTFPNTNVIGVIGWSNGCIVDPKTGEIRKEFALPTRTSTLVHTKNGFLLLSTGQGFSSISASDLDGTVQWKYNQRFAEAYPLILDNNIHYCVAHYTPGKDGLDRFLVLDSEFQTIYQDQTLTAGITTTVKGDVALCQLSQPGTYRQSLILRTFEGAILKKIALKHNYQGLVAFGWPKGDSILAHTKRGFVLLDANGSKSQTVDILPWGITIVDAQAVFYENDTTEYLAVHLSHRSSTDFSTVVILNRALDIVYRERIPSSWRIALYRDADGSSKILVPALGGVIMMIQRNEFK